MVRRLKCHALKQLPPKLRNTVMLKVQNGEDKERLQELNQETKGISRVLNAAMGQAHKGNARAVDLFASVGKDTQQQVMKAFTQCADIKINLVIEHVVCCLLHESGHLSLISFHACLFALQRRVRQMLSNLSLLLKFVSSLDCCAIVN